MPGLFLLKTGCHSDGYQANQEGKLRCPSIFFFLEGQGIVKMLIFQWQVSEVRGSCHCRHYHSGASQEEQHVREASRLLLRPACSLRVFRHKSHCLICPPGTQRTRALVCTCSPCPWSQGSTFHFGGEKPLLPFLNCDINN